MATLDLLETLEQSQRFIRDLCEGMNLNTRQRGDADRLLAALHKQISHVREELNRRD